MITLPREAPCTLWSNRHELVQEVTALTIMETQPLIESATTDLHVHEAVGRKINACPYGFIFKNVSWQYAEGRLTLLGCVPNFYLKQVLQELMRHIEQVEQIANHVDVVNSAGMSSEPPNKPRDKGTVLWIDESL